MEECQAEIQKWRNTERRQRNRRKQRTILALLCISYLYFFISVFVLGIFSAFLMVDGEVLWHNLMM